MDPETPCPYLFGPRRYIPPQLREVTSTQDDLLAASQRQAQREATQAQHVFSQLLANYEKPVEMYQSFIDSFPAEDLHNSCAVRGKQFSVSVQLYNQFLTVLRSLAYQLVQYKRYLRL